MSREERANARSLQLNPEPSFPASQLKPRKERAIKLKCKWENCHKNESSVFFNKPSQLCNKHWHQTVTPSTTPDASLKALKIALKVFLPDKFHNKIERCCHQPRNYLSLFDKGKQDHASLLGIVIGHIADQT